MKYRVNSSELGILNNRFTNVTKLLFDLSSKGVLLLSSEDYCNLITHPSFIQHYLAHAIVSKVNKQFVWQGIEVVCFDSEST